VPLHPSQRHLSNNLYVCDSVQTSDESYYQNNQSQKLAAAIKSAKSSLRSSSSLVSLLPSSNGSSHFWHCSNHTSSSSSAPSSVSKVKRSNTGSGSKARPNPGQCQSNWKPNKSANRKGTKSQFCAASSSSSSNKSESDDQQVPQTRSILRHSASSKYKNFYQGERQQARTDNELGQNELDYWDRRKRMSYELSSHSDSESSDITISSGESGECIRSPGQPNSWQAKRRNSHKVCFVDEIVQHPITTRKCTIYLGLR